MHRRTLLLALAALPACDGGEDPPPVFDPGPAVAEDVRAPCADRRPERQPLFGDLHVHGAFSFDARSYDTIATPEQVLAFAQGEPLDLPPLVAGEGTRTVQLDRPLDFVSLTEHGEFLGEIALCTTEGSPGYDHPRCVAYREGTGGGALDFGVFTSSAAPVRDATLCGEDGSVCAEPAAERWLAMQEASEAAYDRTSTCAFTTFVGYEYTNTVDVSNLHRNVIFRNHVVPDKPVTHFEAPTPRQLWDGLRAACPQAGKGCDVMALPHNANLSNGKLFLPEEGEAPEVLASRARDRAAMEPVVEIFQHKGDSECRDGLGDLGGAEDPACDFEKLRPADDPLCEPYGTGSGGMRLWGCVHRLNFHRNVLAEGLIERRRIGVNPYKLGVIGSTDTHNGTPGFVRSADFPGHVGLVDDTPDKRLGDGTITHDGLINNPGGLAGVWAVENARDAIFEALRAKETFATSGPRIPIRLFGGADLPDDLCDRDVADAVAAADQAGVPMGGTLPASAGAPRIFAYAEADPGTETYPGVPLQQLQIIKVWVDADGERWQSVTVVDGDPDNGASVDPATCETTTAGEDRLCAVWTDPDHDPSVDAVYYARALEDPTCRWSTQECVGLGEEAPDACESGQVADVVQQRAWSSPVWVEAEDVSGLPTGR